MLVLIINTLAGAAACVAYTAWAWKHLMWRAYALAALNAIIALVALALAIGYGLIAVDSPHQPTPANSFRTLIPVLLLLPALTRWLELRRAEKREAFAEAFERELNAVNES